MTGGHLGAGLGVVELTVALHYVFDTPRDRLIWDVGHQAYPHKILTGRRDRIRTLRQPGGLSGFTRRAESEYDPFGAAHSSTSISAALGMAVARDLDDKQNNVIAVIGDGAMSAGMAYEAMNNAGHLQVAPDRDPQRQRHVDRAAGRRHVGAPRPPRLGPGLPRHPPLRQAHRRGAAAACLRDKMRLTEEFARSFWTGGTLFDELGFYYVGPIDGHNLDHLLPVLKNVRDMRQRAGAGPRRDQEGQGLRAGRGVGRQVPRRRQVRRRHRQAGQGRAVERAILHRVFADSLIREAEADERIVAITAAMPSGTGLDLFAEALPRARLSTSASPSSTR